MRHTLAFILVQENAGSDVLTDLSDALGRLVPRHQLRQIASHFIGE
ncbi:MAG: YjbQ family protein [Parvibaculum sedimenti]|nr:YjbQ family protein [Parvibaculum sedimenti]